MWVGVRFLLLDFVLGGCGCWHPGFTWRYGFGTIIKGSSRMLGLSISSQGTYIMINVNISVLWVYIRHVKHAKVPPVFQM